MAFVTHRFVCSYSMMMIRKGQNTHTEWNKKRVVVKTARPQSGILAHRQIHYHDNGSFNGCQGVYGEWVGGSVSGYSNLDASLLSRSVFQLNISVTLLQSMKKGRGFFFWPWWWNQNSFGNLSLNFWGIRNWWGSSSFFCASVSRGSSCWVSFTPSLPSEFGNRNRCCIFSVLRVLSIDLQLWFFGTLRTHTTVLNKACEPWLNVKQGANVKLHNRWELHRFLRL